MCLQIRRVDHYRLRLGTLGGQPFHHAEEDTHLTPALLTVVERLVRAIRLGRIPPPQLIAVDENDATQHAPIIDPWPAVDLRKIGPKPRHLLVSQPIQVAHASLLAEPESDRASHINGS